MRNGTVNIPTDPSSAAPSPAVPGLASSPLPAPFSAKERLACASCKHQRKKCTSKCAFAPYFPSSATASFEAVQKVFGVSNMTKMMSRVPPEGHGRMFESLVWEARGRERDPAEGCYVEVRRLEQENAALRSMISSLRSSGTAATRYVCHVCRNYRNYQLYQSYGDLHDNANGVMTAPPPLHETQLLRSVQSDDHQLVNIDGWPRTRTTACNGGPPILPNGERTKT